MPDDSHLIAPRIKCFICVFALLLFLVGHAAIQQSLSMLCVEMNRYAAFVNIRYSYSHLSPQQGQTRSPNPVCWRRETLGGSIARSYSTHPKGPVEHSGMAPDLGSYRLNGSHARRPVQRRTEAIEENKEYKIWYLWKTTKVLSLISVG